MFFTRFVPPGIGRTVRACVLKPGMARTAKEATNACYLKHFGSPGKYRKRRIHDIYNILSPQEWVGPPRKRRMHAIYSTFGPQCGIGSRKQRMHAIYNTLGPGGNIGGHDCMLFTARWAPREVSEATIACYLRHVGPPGRYRRPRLYAIYDTLGPQGGIGSTGLTRTAPG